MIKKLCPNTGVSACLLGLFLFTGISLRSEEKTWTGALDGSWANGGNWSPSALLTDVDGVLYDTPSTANLSQTLDQNWSITGLRVAGAANPITILPGSFTLTNAGGIDMSAATADLTILVDYYAVNNSIWNVAAGRTLTVSNTTAALSSATPMYGNGTVRVVGTLQRSDQFNGITLIADGANITGNPPVRLNADTGSTITVIVTNNSVLNITGGNSTRIHIGNANLADGTNHLILDGGSINIEGSGSAGANGMFVAGGQGTVGILDINNGSIDMSDRNGTSQLSVLRIGNAVGSRGTVNLNAGGILRTPRIDRIDGYAVFNFNGGYLETTSPRDDYFDLVDEVNILAGGAVIDTGDRIIGVAAPLSGEGSLTKLGAGTLTLARSQSYAGQTIVSNGNLVVTLPMSSSALVMETNTMFGLSLATVPDSTWSPTSVTLNGSNTLTLAYGISSEPSATLIDTASLSVVGTNVINIVGLGWATGTTRLIHYGSMSGGGKFRLGTLPVGLNAKLTNNPATSAIELIVSSGVNNLEWYGLNAFGDTAGGLWDIATTANWDGGESVYQEYGTTNILGDSVNFTPSGYAFVEIAATVRPSSVIVSNLSSGTPYSFMGSGKISGSTSLIKDGNAASSAMTLATQNDYAGGTFIRMGSISLGTNDALPTSGLVYVGSPNSGASLILNGFNQTIGGLIAAGSGGGTRRVLNNSLTPSVLTINVAANQTNAYTHTMGNPGAASTDAANNFSIVKTGPGIQAFSNCGYGGTTTISGGTLLFNSTATALTGDITVQAGGTLGGNVIAANAIGAPVTVQSGGKLEPGNLGIGTLNVGNTVTLQGEVVIELNNTNTPSNDQLAATNINFGGTLTVVNVGDALLAGNSFTLFSGAFSGNFANVVLPPLTPGLLWNTNNLMVDGSISIDALPRPSFASPTFSGNDLVLSGTGGAANGTYYILASPDIAVPLTNWTVLVTNTFDASGGFSFTNAVNPGSPQRFFTLQTP